MTRRDLLRMGAPFFALPGTLTASPCLTQLDSETAAEYDAYLAKARAAAEQPFGPVLLERIPAEQRVTAQQTLNSRQPYLWNVHQKEPNGALEVSKGVIVHWIGAVLIQAPSPDVLENVLQQYGSYNEMYHPFIVNCYGKPSAGPGEKNFTVTSVLHDVVTKPGMLVPDQHFAFEITAESNFFWLGPENSRTLVVRTHATKIREADGGKPSRADSRTKNDLLPPDYGHGIIWRSDTWWRATRRESGVYAEYESLSLARSLDAVEVFSACGFLRLPGLRDKALESMTVRPRKTVTAVMAATKNACEKSQTTSA